MSRQLREKMDEKVNKTYDQSIREDIAELLQRHHWEFQDMDREQIIARCLDAYGGTVEYALLDAVRNLVD